MNFCNPKLSGAPDAPYSTHQLFHINILFVNISPPTHHPSASQKPPPQISSVFQSAQRKKKRVPVSARASQVDTIPPERLADLLEDAPRVPLTRGTHVKLTRAPPRARLPCGACSSPRVYTHTHSERGCNAGRVSRISERRAGRKKLQIE